MAENFSDYTLTFYSKIARGGAGWAVVSTSETHVDLTYKLKFQAYPLFTLSGGIQLNLIRGVTKFDNIYQY
jgi:hypothetical protein